MNGGKTQSEAGVAESDGGAKDSDFDTRLGGKSNIFGKKQL